MWLEQLNKKIKLLDQVLTNLTNLLKKHWLILVLLLIGAFGYLYFFTDWFDYSDDPQDQQIEQIDSTNQ